MRQSCDAKIYVQLTKQKPNSAFKEDYFYERRMGSFIEENMIENLRYEIYNNF